jgi:hypothetical protein
MTRWLYASEHSEDHMWSTLFYHQAFAGCADTRDRLSSALGLLENGKEIPVSYEEEAKDLF